jgi:type IV fimbrial biogenesis protein FimT
MGKLSNLQHRGSAGGFTLVELLVTFVIVTILVTLALPSLSTLIQTQHVKTGASDLQATLFFARSEALKRAVNVEVVPAANDWKGGWKVQLADGTVLRSQPPLNTRLSSMAVASGVKITYQPDGHVSSAPPAIVVRVSSNPKVTARCVVTDLSGRPSVVNDSDGDPDNGCI